MLLVRVTHKTDLADRKALFEDADVKRCPRVWNIARDKLDGTAHCVADCVSEPLHLQECKAPGCPRARVGYIQMVPSGLRRERRFFVSRDKVPEGRRSPVEGPWLCHLVQCRPCHRRCLPKMRNVDFTWRCSASSDPKQGNKSWGFMGLVANY